MPNSCWQCWCLSELGWTPLSLYVEADSQSATEHSHNSAELVIQATTCDLCDCLCLSHGKISSPKVGELSKSNSLLICVPDMAVDNGLTMDHDGEKEARAAGAARMRKALLSSMCQECQEEIKPGDDIYPVEGGAGLKRSSLCWLHLACAERLGSPPVPPCKHFLRSGLCQYGGSCFFAHPEEAGNWLWNASS